MRRLIVFNFITLDGYFKGPKEDLSWHKHGAEENSYAAGNLEGDNVLLFGRVTYEVMASYWPTSEALKNDYAVAERMNAAAKIVFSKTLKKATWNNTRIIKDDMANEIKKLKQLPGNDLTLLGSGSILTQFAEQRLIDEYQIMIDPLAIGKGTSIFKGLNRRLELRLINTRTFKRGVVLLTYKPLQ